MCRPINLADHDLALCSNPGAQLPVRVTSDIIYIYEVPPLTVSVRFIYLYNYGYALYQCRWRYYGCCVELSFVFCTANNLRKQWLARGRNSRRVTSLKKLAGGSHGLCDKFTVWMICILTSTWDVVGFGVGHVIYTGTSSEFPFSRGSIYVEANVRLRPLLAP